MFGDLVATWFVFSCSCLNSSFPASTGIWRRQQNKKEISSLRGEKSNCVEEKGVFCPSFDPDPLGLSFIWVMCIRMTLCFHLCVWFLSSVLFAQQPHHLFKKRSITDAHYNIRKNCHTYANICPLILSSIYVNNFFLHTCTTDAQCVLWCLADVHVWRWYQVSSRWKGGTGLEIAAAATVGSWGPRHPERCCSNQGPSGGNRKPRTLQKKRGGERKINARPSSLALSLDVWKSKGNSLASSAFRRREGVRLKQPLTDRQEPAMEDSTSPQSHAHLLSSYSPSPLPVFSLWAAGTDASMTET